MIEKKSVIVFCFSGKLFCPCSKKKTHRREDTTKMKAAKAPFAIDKKNATNVNFIKWTFRFEKILNTQQSEYRWFSRYVIAAMLEHENKRFLISSFCPSTSNCTLQNCYVPLEIGCKPWLWKISSKLSSWQFNFQKQRNLPSNALICPIS